MLVEKVDADWIKGRLRGQEGIFPSGFVEVKVDLALKSKSAASPAPPPSTHPGPGTCNNTAHCIGKIFGDLPSPKVKKKKKFQCLFGIQLAMFSAIIITLR